uniref:Uncharacterized protein n=1 Tax=Pyxicephalus adspersus TaxID=30357 RepID=A0AAV3AFX6_PYXAD|nr:TPA: hypothetical protein GDO54_013162 [Pyxicephalus adspersus]
MQRMGEVKSKISVMVKNSPVPSNKSVDVNCATAIVDKFTFWVSELSLLFDCKDRIKAVFHFSGNCSIVRQGTEIIRFATYFVTLNIQACMECGLCPMVRVHILLVNMWKL